MRMQLQTEITQTDRLEPAIDNVESGTLFRYEEHAAAKRQIMGNHVGDSLRFARSWRSIEHKIMALARRDHGGELR